MLSLDISFIFHLIFIIIGCEAMKNLFFIPLYESVFLENSHKKALNNAFLAEIEKLDQQERMYQTIRDAKADGVFILSGDVHIAEVNKRTASGLYPLWDFTSSGLAQFHGSNTQPSQYRVGSAFDQDNIGTLDIDWTGASPSVKFTAFNSSGVSLLEQTISMSDLKIP